MNRYVIHSDQTELGDTKAFTRALYEGLMMLEEGETLGLFARSMDHHDKLIGEFLPEKAVKEFKKHRKVFHAGRKIIGIADSNFRDVDRCHVIVVYNQWPEMMEKAESKMKRARAVILADIRTPWMDSWIEKWAPEVLPLVPGIDG